MTKARSQRAEDERKARNRVRVLPFGVRRRVAALKARTCPRSPKSICAGGTLALSLNTGYVSPCQVKSGYVR